MKLHSPCFGDYRKIQLGKGKKRKKGKKERKKNSTRGLKPS